MTVKHKLEMTLEEFVVMKRLVRETIRDLDQKLSDHHEALQQREREIEAIVLTYDVKDREEVRTFLLSKVNSAIDHDIDTLRHLREVDANLEQASVDYVLATRYQPTPITADEKVGDHLVTADLSKKDRDLLKLAGVYLLSRVNDPVVGMLYCVQDGTKNVYYTPYDLRAAIECGRQFFKETRKSLRGGVQ